MEMSAKGLAGCRRAATTKGNGLGGTGSLNFTDVQRQDQLLAKEKQLRDFEEREKNLPEEHQDVETLKTLMI